VIDETLLGLFQSLNQDAEIRENYVRAPFGYPGAKFHSLDHILPELPYRKKFGEVFGGSGKVLLARHASHFEVFNDKYSGVTCFYRVLRNKELLQKLIERVEEVVHSREEFIWCKNTWKNCEDEVERAARWFYTIRMSFGAQCRNFGRSTESPSMIRAYHNSIKLFPACHNRLGFVTIENQDWRQCLNDYDDYDMVWYLDPEYWNTTRGMYEVELKKSEHIEILERIQSLKGFVAISSYPNELYNGYEWDHVKTWEVKTSTLAAAFHEENNLKGFENVLQRKNATEALYIKE